MRFMKKIASILVLLTLMIALSACANNTDSDQSHDIEPSPDATAVYAPVLEGWKTAVQENFGYSNETQDIKTYPFVCQNLPDEYAQVHYAYYDIDGNTIPELLIASFSDAGYAYICDAYTIHNAQPVRLFEGVEDRGFWSRNRLDLSKDGKSLIVSGSDGAAYANTDFYSVAKNGYQVEWIEGLTTYNPDDRDDLTPYHHLPDGTYEIADDLDQVMEQYKTAPDGGANSDYFSAFYNKIDWQPVVRSE